MDICSAAIGDFDTAKDTFASEAKSVIGTPSFIAPEVLEAKGGNAYTEKCDVYSFGILLYEIVTSRSPWHGIPMLRIASHILDGDVPEKPDDLDAAFGPLVELYHLAMRRDPTKRPTFGEIVHFLQRLLALLEPTRSSFDGLASSPPPTRIESPRSRSNTIC
jgi:sterile alpha motif and leucine zipper containing kinase AZK